MIKVVLVGRPNVGKSTLFNRLVGAKKAIVSSKPGVTRDRKYHEASIVDINFVLIDTAGIEETFNLSSLGEIEHQTKYAINDSDIIIFVIDGRSGVLPIEHTISTILIKTNKPTILLVNKCEGSKGNLGLIEANSLAFSDIIPFSAEHGDGLVDLYDALKKKIKENNNLIIKSQQKLEITEHTPSIIKLSIVGRPNTGKSTLVNNILGEKRMVTGSQAGITRDSIEVSWKYKNKIFSIIDTAGLRKKSKIVDKIERDMVKDTLKSIKYSNVCILVIDVNKGVDKQDLTIAKLIVEEGRGLIIGANMWDKVIQQQETKNKIFYQLKKSLSQIKNIPIVFISGLKSQGLSDLLDVCIDTNKRLDKRIPTGKLNKWLFPIIDNNPAPLYKGKQNKIRYITQVNIRPPTFAVFMSSPESLPNSYKRFLMSSLMKDFDLSGLPIRLMLRKGKNPYT